MRELVKVRIQRHSMIRRPCVIRSWWCCVGQVFPHRAAQKPLFGPKTRISKNIGEYWITPSRTVKRNNTGNGGGSGAKVNARESRKGIRVLRTVNLRHQHRVRCCVGTGGLIQPRLSSKYIAALPDSCMGAHRMFFSSEALQKAQSRFLERPAAGILWKRWRWCRGESAPSHPVHLRRPRIPPAASADHHPYWPCERTLPGYWSLVIDHIHYVSTRVFCVAADPLIHY